MRWCERQAKKDLQMVLESMHACRDEASSLVMRLPKMLTRIFGDGSLTKVLGVGYLKLLPKGAKGKYHSDKFHVSGRFVEALVLYERHFQAFSLPSFSILMCNDGLV